MSDPLRIVVYGRPAPKGSRTVGVTGQGRMFTRPASKFEKPWHAAVAAATRMALESGELPEPPYSVTLVFLWKRPAKSAWPWPSTADLDKVVRATLDGLQTGGAITNDRYVTELANVRSAWAEFPERNGCQIVVSRDVRFD